MGHPFTEYNVTGAPNLTNFNQSYSYLSNGQLQSSPQGNFTYDERGLVKTRTVFAVNAVSTYTYGYDVMGRNSALTFPDGHTRTQSYDDEGRIESRCYTYPNAPGGQIQHCYGATYDPVGNPLTLTDPAGTDTITYDALDRVTKVTRSTTSDVETYSYNAIGALSYNATVALDAQRPGLGIRPPMDSAVPNTYGGQAITLNGAGQITSLAGTALAFNYKGQISSVAGKSVYYDPFGRIAEWDSGPFVYTYDGANRSSQWSLITGRNGWQKSFWVFDGIDHPLEHDDTLGNQQFYEIDLAGNVRRLMGAGGTDLGGYRYTAFGETYTTDPAFVAPTGANALPLRWKGAWLMYSTGSGASQVDLYDMRARWWCPQLGVFLKIDGFDYQDATSTLWAWPGQNPLRWSDPTGHYKGEEDNYDPVTAWLLGQEDNGNLAAAQDFAAGVASNATFGGSDKLFEALGIKNNTCSGAFAAGQLAGTLASVLNPAGAAKGGINITARGLAHVLKRHAVGGALAVAGEKSIFLASENIPQLIQAAEAVGAEIQAGGNFERVVDAGRSIGVDRATGALTSIYTVITDVAGDLITAFPGKP